MPDLHVLRVFCNEQAEFGNPLGVVLDAPPAPPEARQAIATELGFSETVFVDDAATGTIRIFTPALELPFAGHPTVGTAWLIARERGPITSLAPPAGRIAVRTTDDGAHVTARSGWPPSYKFEELGSPADVDALSGPPDSIGDPARYAWIDRDAGTVRMRVFPVSLGIAEDEATGSAAVQLAALLDREIVIHQGRGSVIEAAPQGGGWVEIGGRVVLDEVRQLP